MLTWLTFQYWPTVAHLFTLQVAFFGIRPTQHVFLAWPKQECHQQQASVGSCQGPADRVKLTQLQHTDNQHTSQKNPPDVKQQKIYFNPCIGMCLAFPNTSPSTHPCGISSKPVLHYKPKFSIQGSICLDADVSPTPTNSPFQAVLLRITGAFKNCADLNIQRLFITQ